MMSSHNDTFAASGSSPTVDFACENHGSIFLLRPLTPSATSWLEEHIGQDNGFQPYWPTCVIEHRYIWPILEGIQNDGLAVQA
jgi:hypothetical protein